MKTNTGKKLDVVMRYFLPVTAGIEINVWQTYRTLAAEGWDITIHTTRDTYLDKNSLLENEVIDGLKIRRYEFHTLGFRPQIDWERTDGICLHNFDMFPQLWIMLRVLFLKIRNKKRFSLFVTPHGGFSPEGSDFPVFVRIIKQFYTNTLGVFLLNRAVDGIRAVSPWEAEVMKERGVRSDLIRVITNGLEAEAYADIEGLASPEIREKCRNMGQYIMDNSRIKPIKNIETIIRALALLPKHIQFVHIGTTQNTQYKEELLSIARSLGVESRVHFLGVVRGIDKYYLYKHASVFAHPALWEANANVVHEAWSQGLITIVGDSTGMRSQVADCINGYRVPVRDSKALAKLIEFSIDSKNSPVLNPMREKNMEYVRTHTWREVGLRMGEFYSSHLKNPANVSAGKMIQKIISEKKPCYFISPHLDDAVFSAGSLIAELAKHTDVYVVSIFTEANETKTLSVRAFLRQCGFKSATELFSARRSEDKAVVEKIGAKPIHLGFTDAPWRRTAKGRAIYPTHRWHIAKGIASEDDWEMILKIKDALHDLIIKNNPRGYEVFAPSAIGVHVDHAIVRDIAKVMFPGAVFWADVPYIINSPEAVDATDLGRKEALAVDAGEKENMLKGYKTQFKAMFGDKPVDLPEEIFYTNELATKKLRVSVGIPAYNEEGNIKHLLESLLVQKEINFDLEEIIVASDGSTDRTVSEVLSFSDKRIKIIDSKERQGAMYRQNEILKKYSGNILVLLNADILPGDNFYLCGMISPLLNNPTLGIVSNKGIPLPAETFMEKIVNLSVLMKMNLLEQYKSGDNIYLCHGHSRAFSRAFTETLEWPGAVAEDAYSYLKAKELGFGFYYQPSAEVYYRSPQNLMDHIKQSSRFISSKKGLSKYFDVKILDESFKLPFGRLVLISIKHFIKHPVLFAGYVFILTLSAIDAYYKNRAVLMWDLSKSSKVLIKK